MRLISIVAVLGLLVCSGCGKQEKKKTLTEGKTPAEERAYFKAIGAKNIPENYKERAIEAVRSYFEKNGTDHKHYEYAVGVGKTDGDWVYWVHVDFGTNYDGSHCEVEVSRDFKVKRVRGGA